MHLTRFIYAWSALIAATARPADLWSSDQLAFGQVGKETPKVNVTLYVMSRCPDARLCESVFDEVLKHPGIQDKIDFRLDFIAHRNKTEKIGVECKHGPLECDGNIHDLCLQRHTPLTQFWPTVQCQNFESPFPGRIGNINLTKRCAETNKVDWKGSGVEDCILGESGEGQTLLLDSIGRTEMAEVTKSCTIDIGPIGKRRCVVDGGQWSGCDDGHAASDFVRVIQEEWDALRV